jgi:hypothetical protein
MNKFLILCNLFILLVVGCKKDDNSTNDTNLPNSLFGTWNIVQLKIDSLIVDPSTRTGVLVKLVLNSDYSGQASWADSGAITRAQTIAWSSVVDTLKIQFSSTSPNAIPLYYSLSDNTLNIKYQSMTQLQGYPPEYYTNDYIFQRKL